jgi:hypothetical protein
MSHKKADKTKVDWEERKKENYTNPNIFINNCVNVKVKIRIRIFT